LREFDFLTKDGAAMRPVEEEEEEDVLSVDDEFLLLRLCFSMQ